MTPTNPFESDARHKHLPSPSWGGQFRRENPQRSKLNAR